MLALAVVEEFLGEYIGAFNARDGARIASMYNVPCVTVRGIRILASRFHLG